MIHPKLKKIVVILGLLVLAGCSKSDPTGPGNGNGNGNGNGDQPLAFIVDEAWKDYDLGDFTAARSDFDFALSKDSTYAPAISGRAWTNLELGFTGLSNRQFESALAESTDYISAFYGRAITSHAEALNFPTVGRERLEIAVDAGTTAINLGGDSWQFERIDAINARSLRVLLASSFYALGNYSIAQEQLNVLDPNNGLDPRSPDYIRLLLLAIESQRELL